MGEISQKGETMDVNIFMRRMVQHILIVSLLTFISIWISNNCLANSPGSAIAFRASTMIESLKTALELFKKDTGAYPSNEQGLQSLIERPPDSANWNGPYW